MPFNNLRSGTGPTDIPLGAPSGTNEQAEKQFAHRKGAVWHDTLKYPIDLEGQPFYPESIKFTVYRRHGASLKKIQKFMFILNFREKMQFFIFEISLKQLFFLYKF